MVPLHTKLLTAALGTFGGCGIMITVIGGYTIWEVTTSSLSSQLGWFVSLMALLLTIGILLDIMAIMQWYLNKNLNDDEKPPPNLVYSGASIFLMTSIIILQVVFIVVLFSDRSKLEPGFTEAWFSLSPSAQWTQGQNYHCCGWNVTQPPCPTPYGKPNKPPYNVTCDSQVVSANLEDTKILLIAVFSLAFPELAAALFTIYMICRKSTSNSRYFPLNNVN